MKRLLILIGLIVLTVTTTGCRHGRMLRRGDPCCNTTAVAAPRRFRMPWQTPTTTCRPEPVCGMPTMVQSAPIVGPAPMIETAPVIESAPMLSPETIIQSEPGAVYVSPPIYSEGPPPATLPVPATPSPAG